MSDATPRFKVNPAVAITPSGPEDTPGFRVENLLQKRRFSVSDARMFEMLDHARTWTDRETLVEDVREEFDLSESEAASAVDALVEHDLLVTEDSRAVAVERATETWRDRGWSEALEYYLYIRDYPYIDYTEGKEAFEKDYSLMQEYGGEDAVPPIYKTYDVETVDLPPVDEGESLPALGDVLGFDDDRETAPSVDERTLSSILYYTLGETGTLSFPYQGEFLLKTSPSGGARHPTEGYVVVFDVDGIDRGIYHYSVKDHGLEPLTTDDFERRVRDSLYGLTSLADFDVSFTLLFSSVLERSMWRYREPRTYSVIMNDVGHLIETCRLVCNAHDLETRFSHKFDESEVVDLFSLDKFEEPPLCFGVIG